MTQDPVTTSHSETFRPNAPFWHPGLIRTIHEQGVDGHFGDFGGAFIPEVIVPAVDDLRRAYLEAREDLAFWRELDGVGRSFAGRPTPVYLAERFSQGLGDIQVVLKREDLAHTGAHKINNALGQGLLARRMGRQRIIAETGAGQHGVAAATVCAKLGLECVVYMGTEDIERQALNVYRMQLLGAEVRPVDSGTRTLKDAINEAFRDWCTNVESTYYMLGSATGPHPYPLMVRDFQSVIGWEARRQCLEQFSHLPDAVVACVGGGSNAIGGFMPFVEDAGVALIGVEAGGSGIASGAHAATLSAGSIGILHGTRSLVLQNADGQILGTHSISAGLDYPGVGPEHAFLKTSGRAQYVSIEDEAAIRGFRLLSSTEGIMPALESAHAVAYVADNPQRFAPGSLVLIILSGRGDKDVNRSLPFAETL
ncbi:MAG: tryptophan synthase subunit beta [Chloroflexi bacterium]|nr:tryptophan synthase subunit beta [Chloroflexota bacterium]